MCKKGVHVTSIWPRCTQNSFNLAQIYTRNRLRIGARSSQTVDLFYDVPDCSVHVTSIWLRCTPTCTPIKCRVINGVPDCSVHVNFSTPTCTPDMYTALEPPGTGPETTPVPGTHFAFICPRSVWGVRDVAAGASKGATVKRWGATGTLARAAIQDLQPNRRCLVMNGE